MNQFSFKFKNGTSPQRKGIRIYVFVSFVDSDIVYRFKQVNPSLSVDSISKFKYARRLKLSFVSFYVHKLGYSILVRSKLRDSLLTGACMSFGACYFTKCIKCVDFENRRCFSP